MLHNFRTDDGVKLLVKPTNLLRNIPLSNVIAHNLVSNSRRRKHLKNHISEYYYQRRMISGFEIKVTAAEIEKPRYKKTYVVSKGKAVLNGASGSRARNTLRKGLGFSEESIIYFRDTFSRLVDPNSLNLSSDIPKTCWIDAKNYHNFFHFLTESLHLICSSDLPTRHVERVIFISKSKRSGEFVRKWIHEACQIIGHSIQIDVVLATAVERYEKIILPFSCEHLLYQFSGEHHNQIEAAKPAGGNWTRFDGTPHHVKILQYNSYDETLRTFRDRMIQRASQTVPRTWSKLIYAIRSKGLVRNRVMQGEKELTSKLENIGFEVVCFEDMSPLEQVKCVSGASCLVMQHGAGMANMIFTSSHTHVIELGTYQTALARWSDFIQISHVCGCHYHQVFLDMDYPDERTDPVFSEDGLIAPMLSREDVDKVTAIIQAAIGDSRSGVLAGAMRHCEYFIARGAYKQAYRVLDQNAQFFDHTPDYWLQRHHLASVCGHVERARDALIEADRLTRTS